MKIILATYGSRGDVQPMLALSLALQSAGCEVLLAAPPEKAEWAAQLGCPFKPLGSDVTAFIDDHKDAHSIRSGVDFVAFVRREILTQFRILPKLIRGADLVIGSSLVLGLATVAESMGIDYRYIAFTPQILPSRDHPVFILKHQGLPKWYNRITWMIARMLDTFNFTALVNRERKRLGLKPIPDAFSHVLGNHVMVASDKAVAHVPRDVGIRFTQTGYLHLKQTEPAHPDLKRFLESGPPPAYAGFGSMPKKDQAGNVAMIVQAARSVGLRLVIAKFWDEPSGYSGSNDVLFIKGYPHLMLFPRMAAVIHHGGAGTTASCAVSGVPQIIVPHILDQYYWGHKVYQSNLGPKPIWRSKLSSRKLAGALKECISNPSIKEKAKETQKRIKPQDSLQKAVRYIVSTNKMTEHAVQ